MNLARMGQSHTTVIPVRVSANLLHVVYAPQASSSLYAVANVKNLLVSTKPCRLLSAKLFRVLGWTQKSLLIVRFPLQFRVGGLRPRDTQLCVSVPPTSENQSNGTWATFSPIRSRIRRHVAYTRRRFPIVLSAWPIDNCVTSVFEVTRRCRRRLFFFQVA